MNGSPQWGAGQSVTKLAPPPLAPTQENLPILMARSGFYQALAQDNPALAKQYQQRLYKALEQRRQQGARK